MRRLLEQPWSSDVEAALLDVIAALYVGFSPQRDSVVGVSISVAADGQLVLQKLTSHNHPTPVSPPDDFTLQLTALVTRTGPLYDNAYSLIFDSLPLELSLRDRFVGFTGPFRQFTRRTCFEEVRKLGGVAAEVDWYLDYLFVSDEHVNRQLVSSSLAAGISCRLVHGNPLIFRERDWLDVVRRGSA